MPQKKLRVFRTPRTDRRNATRGAHFGALALTATLALVHGALAALIVFVVLARTRSDGHHFAVDAAGAVAACAFYAWAAHGIFTRRASAMAWTLRVNVILAALGVITFADGWSQTEHAARAVSQMDPVAWVRLGFPAVMIVLYLVGALFTMAARPAPAEAEIR